MTNVLQTHMAPVIGTEEEVALMASHAPLPVEPIEWTVRPSDVRVEFRVRGVPVASSSVGVQVADGRENGFVLPTDPTGRANGGWLQRGRWYWVTRHDPATRESVGGCFPWTGQTTVDLEILPDKPPMRR